MCSTQQGQAVVEVIFVGSFKKLGREIRQKNHLMIHFFPPFVSSTTKKNFIKKMTVFHIDNSSKSLI